jgi:hypothetical protein
MHTKVFQFEISTKTQVQDDEITKCQIELMQDKESDDGGGVDGKLLYN